MAIAQPAPANFPASSWDSHLRMEHLFDPDTGFFIGNATPSTLFVRPLERREPVAARNWKATFFDGLGDYPTNPNTIILGGHQTWDDAYLKMIGQTISHGDSGGSIVSISNSPFDTTRNRNGAGSSDGMDLFMGTGDNAPRFELGRDIRSSDGITYSIVSFTPQGVIVTPQLSSMARKAFSPRTRIYTNYKTGNAYAPQGLHPFAYPNLYYAHFRDFEDTIKIVGGMPAPVTIIHTLFNPDNWEKAYGWTTENLLGAPTEHPPGANTGDMLDNKQDLSLTGARAGLDFSYAHPALFVGMEGMSQFVENSMTILQYPKDSVTRAAKGFEWDFNVAANGDYTTEAVGLAVAFNTNGHRLADGSVALALGGTGFPEMLGIGSDAEATTLTSAAFWLGAEGFGDTHSNAPDYRRVLAENTISMGPNNENGQSISGHTQTFYLAQRRMADNGDGSHINPVDAAFELGWAEDMVRPLARDNRAGGNFAAGADLARIVEWNGTISMCGGTDTFTATAQRCSAVFGNGTVRMPVIAVTPTDISQGWPYMTASDAHTITLGTTSQATAPASLDVEGVVSSMFSTFRTGFSVGRAVSSTVADTDARGNIVLNSTGTGGGLATRNVPKARLPVQGVADGVQMYCTDCVKNGVAGLPVWWHAQAERWLDATNMALATR